MTKQQFIECLYSMKHQCKTHYCNYCTCKNECDLMEQSLTQKYGKTMLKFSFYPAHWNDSKIQLITEFYKDVYHD